METTPVTPDTNLAPVTEMTTPALVREYARSRFAAGHCLGIGLPRTNEARDRQSALVNELRRRGILD